MLVPFKYVFSYGFDVTKLTVLPALNRRKCVFAVFILERHELNDSKMRIVSKFYCIHISTNINYHCTYSCP